MQDLCEGEKWGPIGSLGERNGASNKLKEGLMCRSQGRTFIRRVAMTRRSLVTLTRIGLQCLWVHGAGQQDPSTESQSGTETRSVYPHSLLHQAMHTHTKPVCTTHRCGCRCSDEHHN